MICPVSAGCAVLTRRLTPLGRSPSVTRRIAYSRSASRTSPVTVTVLPIYASAGSTTRTVWIRKRKRAAAVVNRTAGAAVCCQSGRHTAPIARTKQTAPIPRERRSGIRAAARVPSARQRPTVHNGRFTTAHLPLPGRPPQGRMFSQRTAAAPPKSTDRRALPRRPPPEWRRARQCCRPSARPTSPAPQATRRC